MMERITKQDLHLETTSRLAQLVLDSPPGFRLPTERQLCQELGVSRSTLREAVRSLAFIGALEPRQGSGTYVSSVDGGVIEKLIGLALMMRRCTVRDVIEARRILEVETVRLAALKHDEHDRRELESGLRRMELAVNDPQTASQQDLQFHVLLARASRNSVLIDFVHGMRSLLNLWIRKAVNRPHIIAEIVGEHEAILSAVIDRNAKEAAASMDLHLTKAADRLLEVVGHDHSTEDYISLLFNRQNTFA